MDMLELYDRVRILSNGVTGQIVDICGSGDSARFVVESDAENVDETADYPCKWSLYDCQEDELEKIETE
jgi:hypothetical protein|nr:MAG TPA: hypothetical protein [Caudoviricetes sp.]